MDEYSRQCIKWLIENDRELLAKYVNTASVDVDEVENAILGTTVSTKTEESGIKCRICKKNTVVFLEVQTRSADEGASVFYSCTSCLTHWKQR
jgi:DNA-directed RNA polymerase subunit M/transcription elongation factor TFIIS